MIIYFILKIAAFSQFHHQAKIHALILQKCLFISNYEIIVYGRKNSYFV